MTAFYSLIDMEIEIIFTQNVMELQPTNEYCRFIQTIRAGIRTMPICGPILLCAASFTGIYVKSDFLSLHNMKCYGISLDNIYAVRILKRHTIHALKAENADLEYKGGFMTGYPKDQKMIQEKDFVIIPDPVYA